MSHSLNGDEMQFLKHSFLRPVRAVVSGAKTNGNATIISLSDFREFGQTMNGRTFNVNYRFGYQGSEQDRDILNHNSSYITTEFRMLDPRLGRWFSPDKIVHPWQSPYSSMDNNPIALIDPLGLDGEGPNGECPGDVNTCGNGQTEVYGEDGQWHDMPGMTLNEVEVIDFGSNNTAGQSNVANNTQYLPILGPYQKPSDDDYAGFIQNATPEQRQTDPVKSFFKDFTMFFANFTGFNQVDNAIVVLKDDDASISDKVEAGMSIILAGANGEGEGNIGKGSKVKVPTKVNPEVNVAENAVNILDGNKLPQTSGSNRTQWGWSGTKVWKDLVSKVRSGGTIESLNGKVPTKNEAVKLIQEAGGKVERIEGPHEGV